MGQVIGNPYIGICGPKKIRRRDKRDKTSKTKKELQKSFQDRKMPKSIWE